jgi:hypothetical protein
MNLNEFKVWIKTVSGEVLDSTFDEISAKLGKARNPAIKAGYAIALDELALEKDFRRAGYGPITDADRAITDDELFAELGI